MLRCDNDEGEAYGALLVARLFTGARSGLRANVRATQRLVSGEWFFRATQPGKACIQDGDALRGGWIRCRAPWEGWAWCCDQCASGSLVSTIGSAAPRSLAA
jgi:hypothetical protein